MVSIEARLTALEESTKRLATKQDVQEIKTLLHALESRCNRRMLNLAMWLGGISVTALAATVYAVAHIAALALGS